MEEKQYYVYLLSSKKYGTLYTGITSNLVQRIWQHKEGFAEGFTKKYKVHHLVYNEKHLLWPIEKAQLLWSLVYGFTQRFVPTCYAQAFCQGLYCVAEQNKPLVRSLSIKSSDNQSLSFWLFCWF